MAGMGKTPLLKTKFAIPQWRPQAIERPRLVEQLDEALTRPLTLISAPAGFGKTTLITSWLKAKQGKAMVAWLSLEEDDSDPARFFHYLVAALQQVLPQVGHVEAALLGGLQIPAPKDLVTLILNEVGDTKHRVVLVLDDYHLVRNPEIDLAIVHLVEHAPEQLRLIVSTREQPDLPMGRWRAMERVNEIGLEDLRFSLDEAVAFLTQTMGLQLDAQSARELEARTEGWIAGLQMAALSLRHHSRRGKADPMQASERFSGGHRYVIDYLAVEVLRRQPKEMRDFLRRTAVLERLCAPLCDALTGRTDGKAMLARLEQANMFLLSLDDERQWYRYHQVFGDFLRSGLDAAEAGELHRKASAWHEAHGLAQDAVRHALVVQDYDAVVRVFRAKVEELLSRGEIPTLLAWLEALPDDLLAAESDIAAYRAWFLYLRGRTAEGQAYAAFARFAEQNTAPSAHRGMLSAFHAYLALNWGDPKDAIPLAQTALTQLDSRSFFRVYSLSLLGQAQTLSGDRKAAVETLRQAYHLGRRLGNHMMTLDALGHLVTLMHDEGQLREAIALCREALEEHLDARGRPVPVAGLVCVPLGTLYYAINDVASARRFLSEGIELCRQLGMVYYRMMGHRALAKLLHVAGDREGAWNTLAVAREAAERPESARRRRLVTTTTAELQLREGNVAVAAQTISETRKLPGTPTEREALVHARVLLGLHQPAMAENTLGHLERAARNDKFNGSLIAIHVAQALCKRAQGNRAAAIERLEKAVALAASGGYYRVFLNEGSALNGMLDEVRHVAPGFVSSLLEPLSLENDLALESDVLPEPLSRTELEILALLKHGLTNQEIADRLGMTVGTTKWHLNQTFGKLQVRNRVEALERARHLKLL